MYCNCLSVILLTYLCSTQPVIMGNGPLEQPLVYRVYYNGTTRDVDNITTSLTFPFSPLPVGIYRDNIHLIVTAANRFGSGISSNTAPATVCKLISPDGYWYGFVLIKSHGSVFCGQESQHTTLGTFTEKKKMGFHVFTHA